MTDWKKVWAVVEEMEGVFHGIDPYRQDRDMGWFREWSVETTWHEATIADVMSRLYTRKEMKQIIIERLKERGSLPLTDTEVAHLWLVMPEARPHLSLSPLSPAARTFILTRDPVAFANLYSPNDEKAKTNRDVVTRLKEKTIFNEFMKKISDENLSDILHKYPHDITDVMRTFRVSKTTKHGQRLFRLFDCSKVRNQTHLRRFIYNFPWMMEGQTLEQMEASPLKRDTWARLIADIPVKKRCHFPVGTGDWAKKGIFVKHLKGRKSKPFPDFETGLPTEDDNKVEEPA